MRLARPLVVLALLLALLAAPIVAQMDVSDSDEPRPAPAAAGSDQAVSEEAEPAAAGPVAAPVPSKTAMRYYRSGNWLWIVATLWGSAVPALLLFSGFSARMRDWARRFGRKWFFTVTLYGVLFGIVGFLLDLPLAWHSDCVRLHACRSCCSRRARGAGGSTPGWWRCRS